MVPVAEARAFGVHSDMSSKEVSYERCPKLSSISGNYEKYKTVGLEIRAIFKRYTDLIEPMSIDEAYLDVIENKLGIKSGSQNSPPHPTRYLAGATPDCFQVFPINS